MKHGDSDSAGNARLYRIWKAMKWRCNPRNRTCKVGYFDRGIRVCDAWERDYPAFREWAMANGYADDLTIDRRENDRGYSPDNCRWVGYSEQARNTRRNRFATAFGETKIVEAWAEDPRCAVNVKALRNRLRSGWPDELAVSAPVGEQRGPGALARSIESLAGSPIAPQVAGVVTRRTRHSQPEHAKKFKGVCFDRTSGRYKAQVYFQGKQFQLGHFEDPEDAAVAYDKKVRELRGDQAVTNFVYTRAIPIWPERASAQAAAQESV